MGFWGMYPPFRGFGGCIPHLGGFGDISPIFLYFTYYGEQTEESVGLGWNDC
jgi:hypothetical protein